MSKPVFRLCAYTRQKLLRETMFRIVKTPNHDLKIDLSYIEKGRGCYLSKYKDTILKAKKKRTIEKGLKITDCQNIYDALIKLLE